MKVEIEIKGVVIEINNQTLSDSENTKAIITNMFNKPVSYIKYGYDDGLFTSVFVGFSDGKIKEFPVRWSE